MSIKSKQLDFTGQNIYVGIDVHKKHFTVSIHGDHLAYKTFNQPPESKPLVNYLVRNFRMQIILLSMKLVSLVFGYIKNLSPVVWAAL